MSEPTRWLELGPLRDALERTGVPMRQLLEPTDLSAWHRSVRRGRITETMADRIAIAALGMPLELIYTDLFDFDEVAS